MKLRQRARQVLADAPASPIRTVPELLGAVATTDRDEHVSAARVEIETRSLRAEMERLADRLSTVIAEASRLREAWESLLTDHGPRRTGTRSGRQVCQTCRIGFDADSQRMVSAIYPCPTARAALRALGMNEMGLS